MQSRFVYAYRKKTVFQNENFVSFFRFLDTSKNAIRVLETVK